ncbi:hypothetical protein EBZ80_20415 [bacterium]|nr:hypothetical protein [bacterium]
MERPAHCLRRAGAIRCNISPDGRFLGILSSNQRGRTFSIADLRTGQCRELQANLNCMMSQACVFSPNSRFMASPYQHILWDMTDPDNMKRQVLEMCDNRMPQLCAISDTRLARYYVGGFVCLYRFDGSRVAQLWHSIWYEPGVALSPRWFAVSGTEPTLYNAETGLMHVGLDAVGLTLGSCRFAPGKEDLLVCCGAANMQHLVGSHVFCSGTGKRLLSLPGYVIDVLPGGLLATAEILPATAGEAGDVTHTTVYDMETGAALLVFDLLADVFFFCARLGGAAHTDVPGDELVRNVSGRVLLPAHCLQYKTYVACSVAQDTLVVRRYDHIYVYDMARPSKLLLLALLRRPRHLSPEALRAVWLRCCTSRCV